MRAFGSWTRRQGRNLEWMRGVRESRVRFLEFEVGNDNIAVAAVGMWKSCLFAISTARHFHGRSCGPNALATTSYFGAGELKPTLLPT